MTDPQGESGEHGAEATPPCPSCGQPTKHVSDGTPCLQCHHCQMLWPASFFEVLP